MSIVDIDAQCVDLLFARNVCANLEKPPTASKDEYYMEKHCITCEEAGHTYLECSKLNFIDLISAALGLPNMATGETSKELRSRVELEIKGITPLNQPPATDGQTMAELLGVDVETYREFKAWKAEKSKVDK